MKCRTKFLDRARLNNVGKPDGIEARHHANITEGVHTVSAKGTMLSAMSPVLGASAVGALSDRFD